MKRDQTKTKAQLTNELAEMRHRVAELEASETELKSMKERLQDSEGEFAEFFEWDVGGRAYLSTGENGYFYGLDISNKSDITEIWKIANVPGAANDIKVEGSTLYLANSFDLKIFDYFLFRWHSQGQVPQHFSHTDRLACVGALPAIEQLQKVSIP